MIEDKNNYKSRWQVLLAAGMILPAALCFGVTADSPEALFICVLGLIVSFIWNKPIVYSDRTVIYGLVIAAVLAVMLDLVLPASGSRFSLLGYMFRSNVTAPFLLYLAVIVTFFRSSSYVTGLCACFSLGVVLFSGDIVNFEPDNKRFLFTNYLVRHIQQFQIGVIFLEISMMLLILQESAVSRVLKRSARGRAMKIGVVTLAIILAGVLGMTGMHLVNLYESELRQIESFLVRMGMTRRMGPQSQVVFGNEVNLNRTISPEVEKNQKMIVLRALGELPPGYLRGRVYTRYKNGHWGNPEMDSRKFTVNSPGGILAYKTFFLQDNAKTPAKKVRIYPASRFSSEVLLVPGNGTQYELVADWLNYNPHGVLSPESWEKDGGYTVFMPEIQQDSAWPSPDPTNEEGMTRVPETLNPDLDRFLSEVDSGGGAGKSLEKNEELALVNKLLHKFNNEFKYKLGVANPSKADPIVNFLLKAREGHCELFATAMALLLRRMGIPTRYVTGFICEEAHPSNKYFVARLGNAHAWIEAYLGGKWVLLEPTPASGVPNFNPGWSTIETWSDRLSHWLRQILSDMRRGHFAEAILAVISGLFSALWLLIWHPLRGPIILLAIIAYFAYRRHRKRLANLGALEACPEALRQLREEFQGLESNLAKRLKQPRAEAATIEEWSAKVFLAMSENSAAKFAKLMRQYQSSRYRRVAPSSDEVESFKRAARELRESLKK